MYTPTTPPSLPLSLLGGDSLVHPVEERTAFSVSVQSAGVELSRLSVSIVPLEHDGGS